MVTSLSLILRICSMPSLITSVWSSSSSTMKSFFSLSILTIMDLMEGSHSTRTPLVANISPIHRMIVENNKKCWGLNGLVDTSYCSWHGELFVKKHETFVGGKGFVGNGCSTCRNVIYQIVQTLWPVGGNRAFTGAGMRDWRFPWRLPWRPTGATVS